MLDLFTDTMSWVRRVAAEEAAAAPASAPVPTPARVAPGQESIDPSRQVSPETAKAMAFWTEHAGSSVAAHAALQGLAPERRAALVAALPEAERERASAVMHDVDESDRLTREAGFDLRAAVGPGGVDQDRLQAALHDLPPERRDEVLAGLPEDARRAAAAGLAQRDKLQAVCGAPEATIDQVLEALRQAPPEARARMLEDLPEAQRLRAMGLSAVVAGEEALRTAEAGVIEAAHGDVTQIRAALVAVPVAQRQRMLATLGPEARAAVLDVAKTDEAATAEVARKVNAAIGGEKLDREALHEALRGLPEWKRVDMLARMKLPALRDAAQADFDESAALARTRAAVERAGAGPNASAALRAALDDVPAERRDELVAGLSDEAKASLGAAAAENAAELDRLLVAEGNLGERRELGADDELPHQARDYVEGLSPVMRDQVLAKLPEGPARDKVAAEIAKVNEREIGAAEEERKVQATLKGVAGYIERAGQGAPDAEEARSQAAHATLDHIPFDRRDEALAQMSPEARAAAEEAIAERKEKLTRTADRLKDAIAKGDKALIRRSLLGKSENELKELEHIYGELNATEDGAAILYNDLKHGLDSSNEKDKQDLAFLRAALEDYDGKGATELAVDLTVRDLDAEMGTLFKITNGVLDLADEAKLNDYLRTFMHDKKAMEQVKAYFEAKTKTSLDGALQKIMNEAEYKEASAYERNDPRSANVAILEQGDAGRNAMVLDEARDEQGGLAALAFDYNQHTGRQLSVDLGSKIEAEVPEGVEDELLTADARASLARKHARAEALAALEADPRALAAARKKAEERAAALVDAIDQPHVVGNNFEVTQPLLGLSPAEVALVMEEYARRRKSLHPDADGDLEKDLRGKLEGKDLKAANAALSGDKVLAAVAFVEQAADGAGTNTEAWQKAMETLTEPAERARFQKLMDQHVGGVDGGAYKELNASENGSFDRDQMDALAEVDEDRRQARLSQVKATRGAYGGKLATYIECASDELGHAIGETDAHRRERRQGARKYDLNVILSNTGGGEELQVDALGDLQNERQLRMFKQRMYDENGETALETYQKELSDHNQEAAVNGLGGDYQGFLAERMMAGGDCYVDDDEDRMSKGYELVRLSSDAEDQLEEIEDPEAREARRQELLGEARDGLTARLDELARAKGYADYRSYAATELSAIELKELDDRRRDGKVSEVTQLIKAGETTLGVGKDGAKFYELLADKTPAQMADFRAKFEAETGVDFVSWMHGRAGSPGERRDFDVLIEGNYARMPDAELDKLAHDSPETLIKRVKDLHAAATVKAELDPRLGTVNAAVQAGDALSTTLTEQYGSVAGRLNGRLARVTELEQKLAENGSLDDDQTAELVEQMRFMAGEQKAYTDTKSMVADKVSEKMGQAANIGTVALTGQTWLGEAVGGAVDMAGNFAMDSGRFSLDEAVSRTVSTLGNMALGYATKGMKCEPLKDLTQALGGGVISAASDTRSWNDGGKLVLTGLENMGRNVATTVIGMGTEKVLGQGLAGSFVDAAVDQAATGELGVADLGTIGMNAAVAQAKKRAMKGYHARTADGDDGETERREPVDEDPIETNRRRVQDELDARVREEEGAPRPREAGASHPLEAGASPPRLERATGDEAAQAARRLFDMEKALGTEENPHHQPGDADEAARQYRAGAGELNAVEQSMRDFADGQEGAQNGKCSATCDAWQKKLAAQGLYVPVVSVDGHRFMTAGDVIIDPTFGQFFHGPMTTLPNGKSQYEPFVGTLDEMKVRVQEAIDAGLMPGIAPGTDAGAVIRRTYHCGQEDGGPIEFDAEVRPWTGGSVEAPTGPRVARPVADEDPSGRLADADAQAEAEAADAERRSRLRLGAPDDDPMAATEKSPPIDAGGETDHRVAANNPTVKARAERRVADKEGYRRLCDGAANEAQRVMLERAAAAGRSMGELAALRARMGDMSEAEILRHFTGAGVRQGLANSCVPTAGQICAAEVDPVYAAWLHDHPEAAAHQQRNYVIAAGVDGRSAPVEHGEDMGRARGTMIADLEGHPIGEELRGATLGDYVTVNHAGVHRGAMDGDGTFGRGGAHDAIQRALAQGYPVIVGGQGHARAIIGMVDGPDGRPLYLIQDPASGETRRVAPSELDEGDHLNSISLPREALERQDGVALGGRPQAAEAPEAEDDEMPATERSAEAAGGTKGAGKKEPSPAEKRAANRPADFNPEHAEQARWPESLGYEWYDSGDGKKKMRKPKGRPDLPDVEYDPATGFRLKEGADAKGPLIPAVPLAEGSMDYEGRPDEVRARMGRIHDRRADAGADRDHYAEVLARLEAEGAPSWRLDQVKRKMNLAGSRDMNVQSRLLGEAAADHQIDVLNAVEGKKRWTPVESDGVNRSGVFDKIAVDDDGHYLIIECKGGDATLGTRTLPDGRRVQQGTREYVEDICAEMESAMRKAEKIADPAERERAVAEASADFETAQGIRAALASGKLEYQKVQATVGPEGPGPIEVVTFDLKTGAQVRERQGGDSRSPELDPDVECDSLALPMYEPAQIQQAQAALHPLD